MGEKVFSGEALEKALQQDSLKQPALHLTGMVKASGKPGHVAFSQAGCDGWVDLPTEMIESAEQIGHRGCRDHAHPVMKIALKESSSPEVRILSALLAHVTRGAPTDVPVSAPYPGLPVQGAGPTPGPLPQAMAMLAGSRAHMGGFGGFGGFGPTLPTCRWVEILAPCGSPLPGYPTPMCPTWVSCCTWPNGMTNCPS